MICNDIELFSCFIPYSKISFNISWPCNKILKMYKNLCLLVFYVFLYVLFYTYLSDSETVRSPRKI